MQRTLLCLVAATALFACDHAAHDDTSDVAEAFPQTETCTFDASSIWRPVKGASWDIQLIAPVSTAAKVDIYDIDAVNSDRSLIAELHRLGRKVVCYVNAGAWEPWRPDAARYPDVLKGNPWSADRFADERWLDIRRLDVLLPLIGARFDLAKQKGCDAIDADNMDGFDNSANPRADRTGFPLTHEDQLRFNRAVACEAHKRGMAIGLKNDPFQAAELASSFDFVISEQCFDYNECKHYQSFLDANKPVLLIEYQEDLGAEVDTKFAAMCTESRTLGLSTILKKNALDSFRTPCPGETTTAKPSSTGRTPQRPQTPRTSPTTPR